MTERYLTEVPQVLPFVFDTTTLPVPCTEIALLGLDVRAAMIVQSFPIGSIAELDRLSDQELRTPNRRRQVTPAPVIDEIRQKIAQFNTELRVLDTAAAISANVSPREPVVINARDWFEKHRLTWTGIPKTPVMLDVEEIVGEELGTYLEEAISIYQLSTPRIANEVATMSSGRRRLRDGQVRDFFKSFNIEFLDMNQIRERQKGSLRDEEKDRIVAELSAAPRNSRVSRERLAPMALIVGLAKQSGLWESPVLLSDRDRVAVEFLLDGVSQSEIAGALHISETVVAALMDHAVTRLRRNMRRQGIISNVLDSGQQTDPTVPMLEG